MSYEGHEQWICPLGHLWDSPCAYGGFGEYNVCAVCKQDAVWNNSVDETNGCMSKEERDSLDPGWLSDAAITIKPDHSNCICGMVVEFELLEPIKECVCTCGNKHLVEAPRYKIPEGRGRRV